MTSTSAPATGAGRALPTPAGVFSSILGAAVAFAASKVERKVAGWTDKLNGVAGGDADGGDSSGVLTSLADEGIDELAEGGGTAQKAGAESVKAGLHGENPVLAAIKGAWKSGTPAVRAAIITAAVSGVLLALLSPVLGLVFLVSLLIVAAAHRGRTAEK